VQDIMHDLLEGVCSYDLSLVCRQLIEVFFTLIILINRVQSLHYGYHGTYSRPPVIVSLDNDILSFEA
jgi:hypothetical protein